MSLISAKQLDLYPDHLTYGGTNDRQLRIKDTADIVLGSGGSIVLQTGAFMTIADAPAGPTYAVNKAYVDSVAQGLDVKESVRALSDSDITLANEQTVDGVALVAGDRVLVAGQTDASENGIYVVVDGGAWVRSEDADADSEVTAGLFTFVAEGTSYADTGWVLATNDVIDLGVTNLTFTQFSSAGLVTGGAGIIKVGNELSVELATNSALSFDVGGAAGKLRVDSSIAGSGLGFSAGVLAVNVDDSTVEINADTLRVKAAGITESHLNTSVAGNGLAGGGGSALSVNVDDSTIEINADSLRVKAAGITESHLNTSVAGAGLAGGGGTALSVNVANGIEISGDNVQLASTVAGNGLAYSAGVISLDLNELTDAAIAVASDSIVFIDASDSNSSKKESVADFVAFMAGAGLGSSAGVLAVNVDDATIEINSDTLRLKDGGIEAAKLGFTVRREAIAAASFSYSSPISTFTVAQTPDTAAALVEMQELYRNGVADGTKVAITPAAAGEWRLNGTSLEIYGDVTASGDTFKVLYHS